MFVYIIFKSILIYFVIFEKLFYFKKKYPKKSSNSFIYIYIYKIFAKRETKPHRQHIITLTKRKRKKKKREHIFMLQETVRSNLDLKSIGRATIGFW